MPIGRIQLKHGLESSADFNTMLQAEAYYATDTERLMIANGDGTGLILPSKNEIDTKIGDLTSLTTTEKGSIVGAVNEIDNNLNLVELKIDLGNWITPTLGTGWSHLSGNPLQYRKNGQGKVEFRGGVDITGSPDSSTIFTLASGLRPAADYGFVVRCIGNNSLAGIMFVASSGAFGLLNRTALAAGGGTAVYCNQIQFWTV